MTITAEDLARVNYRTTTTTYRGIADVYTVLDGAYESKNKTCCSPCQMGKNRKRISKKKTLKFSSPLTAFFAVFQCPFVPTQLSVRRAGTVVHA